MLGCLLLNPDYIPECCSILSGNDFVDKRNSDIYSVIIDLNSETEAVSVVNKLVTMGYEHREIVKYVAALEQQVATSHAAPSLSVIIKKLSVARATIEKTTEIIKELSLGGDACTERALSMLSSVGREGMSQLPGHKLRPICFSGVKELPEFPRDVFPSRIEDLLGSISREKKVPHGIANMMLLGVVSCAIAGKIAVKVCDGWHEPIALYCFPTMKSGTGKGRVLGVLDRPLKKAKDDMPESQKLRIKMDIGKLELEIKNMTKEYNEGGDINPEEIVAKKNKKEQLQRRARKFIWYTQDATIESLGQGILAHQPAVAVIDSEATFLNHIMGMYSNVKDAYQLFLTGYMGENGRISRMKNEGSPILDLGNPIINILATPQPSVIESLKNVKGADERGLLARFFFGFFNTIKVDHYKRSCAIQDLGSYYKAIERIMALQYPEEGDVHEPFERFWKLHISEESYMNDLAPFQEWVDDMYCEADGSGGSAIENWARRAGALAVRISGILHTLEWGYRYGFHGQTENPHASVIPDDTVRSAIRIVREFALPHAIYAYNLMGITGQGDMGSAQKLYEILRDRNMIRFNNADLGSLRSKMSMENIFKGLNILIDRGYVYHVGDGMEVKKGRGRPKSVAEWCMTSSAVKQWQEEK